MEEKEIKNKPYPFDEAALAYSKLTDKEAKVQVDKVKTRIKEIKTTADIGKDPRLMFELRELYSTLAWYRMNKNRSKFFRLSTLGPSMRRAKRHPDVRSTARRK